MHMNMEGKTGKRISFQWKDRLAKKKRRCTPDLTTCPNHKGIHETYLKLIISSHKWTHRNVSLAWLLLQIQKTILARSSAAHAPSGLIWPFPPSESLNKKHCIHKQQKHTQNDSLESKVLQTEYSDHTEEKVKWARSNKKKVCMLFLFLTRSSATRQKLQNNIVQKVQWARSKEITRTIFILTRRVWTQPV